MEVKVQGAEDIRAFVKRNGNTRGTRIGEESELFLAVNPTLSSNLHRLSLIGQSMLTAYWDVIGELMSGC